MFATPLGYNDNPLEALNALSKFSKEQAKHFAIGYLHSCNHIKEILTDTRSKFLTMAISTEDSSKIQKITGITRTLDLLEETLDLRAAVLEKFLQEQEQPDAKEDV